jgi:arsenate reductase-like glutaredoxin family protein
MKITEINYTTTPETITERDMTAEELTQWEADKASDVARLAEAETKTAARQAVLDRLDLTEEEAQLIIGGSN